MDILNSNQIYKNKKSNKKREPTRSTKEVMVMFNYTDKNVFYRDIDKKLFPNPDVISYGLTTDRKGKKFWYLSTLRKHAINLKSTNKGEPSVN